MNLGLENYMEMVQERRKTPRIFIKLNIEAVIIYPDEKIFQSDMFYGITENLSSEGMRVILFNVKKHIYHKLFKYPRYLRLIIKDNAIPQSFEINGKIVWIDYHSSKGMDPYCRLGLYLDAFTPEEEDNYENYLDIIKKFQKGQG